MQTYILLRLTMSTSPLLQFLLFWTGFLATKCETIAVSAPVNPVEEGGIFSVHCQVWNLEEGQEVTFLKISNEKVQRIALRGIIMVPDDRMFLAVRQLNDGSTVYFLSVIDAERGDECEYHCKIIDTAGSVIDLPTDYIDISVIYYPDSDPECVFSESLTIMEGSMVTFNCSSVAANPVVIMQWFRTGSSKVLRSNGVVHLGERATSLLSFRAKISDNNAVFLCKVTSSAFPDQTKNCHVGPLSVIPVSDERMSPVDHGPITNIDDPVSSQDNDISVFPTVITQRPPKQIEDCAEVCLSSKGLESKWILATVFAGSIAFIFFILGLVLFVKYLNTRSPYNRPRYVATQKPMTDDIYSELECKQGETKMYMTLQNKQRGLTETKEDSRSERYDPMPNVPKM